MMHSVSFLHRSRWRPIAVVLLALIVLPGSMVTAADASRVSFRNDVMAVLSKSGCNAGVCHGNANGKGGFKLSLRGQDPEFDFRALTRDLTNRRTNGLKPDRSLLLLKPTMQVAHEGGKRFGTGSLEYGILKKWIAAGMPSDIENAPRLQSILVTPPETILVEPLQSVRLKVTAKFHDGTQRDITRLAVYEPANATADVSISGAVRRAAFGENTVIVRYLDRQVPVRLSFVPERPNYRWAGPPATNSVDKHVFAKLKSLRRNPSAVVNDTVFLRRVFLDLLGILPTAEEAKQFAADKRPDKRDRLVDALLKRPEFADFWALKWADLLRVEEKTLDRRGVKVFYGWIRESIATGKPLDQFAHELIAARGSTYKVPPANFYRAMREPFIRAESTAQMFLGVRLQCAKCHNHPFDRWTQDDYYGWANNFARVNYKIVANKRRDKNDKHEFDGEQIVEIAKTGDVMNPRVGRPTPPRFLGDGNATGAANKDRLQELADWVTNDNNDRFAKTQVNRIWFHLMGRGIVDPIDDFRDTNPASNPALLDALANDFVSHQFNMRHVIRSIVTSKTYQLSSVPNATNKDDATSFSRGILRRLTAEQTLDAVARVAGVPVEFNGYPLGTRAGQIPGVQALRLRDKPPSSGDQFLKLFGKPPRLQACECERSEEATLSQTFQLISGPFLNELLTRSGNRITRLLKSNRTEEQRIDELYWAALSRPPGQTERAATATYVRRATNRQAAYEDVVWALLNSHEFLLRR